MVLESVVLLLGFFMGVGVRRERVGRAGFLDFSLNRLRGKKGYSVEGVFVFWHFSRKWLRLVELEFLCC